MPLPCLQFWQNITFLDDEFKTAVSMSFSQQDAQFDRDGLIGEPERGEN